ncbi:MAG: hypothetical protein OXI15_15890 [Chromatiales bacterium]|nr:hypothetical protein [Chromatiales bacterium]
MNKNQPTAHLAANISVTRTTVDSLVGVAFFAIADALTREETMAIAASKVPSFKSAKALRGAINEWQDGTASVPASRPASVAGTELIGFKSRSPSSGTFGAGRRKGHFRDQSIVRTHAQLHAEIVSLQRDSPPTTVGRTAALHLKRKRFPHAYGARHLNSPTHRVSTATGGCPSLEPVAPPNHPSLLPPTHIASMFSIAPSDSYVP